MRRQKFLLLTAIVTCLCISTSARSGKKSTAEADSMSLKGGTEGTVFKSLRIEGEDRVRIDFERPSLNLDVDARSAPGLEWEGFHSVLERDNVDLFHPFLTRTAKDEMPVYARPWLDRFTSGGVARFRPTVEGVDRWQLVVADSRGHTVATFKGKGKPPKEIVWDGRDENGHAAMPGLTYSYVLEAYDEAGNKRNFVGDGFELPAYRVTSPDGMALLFDGGELGAGGATGRTTPAVVLEAASWINQGSDITKPIEVEVTARRFEDAKAMADGVAKALTPLVLGASSRIKATTRVIADAPERGAVQIAFSAPPAKK
jgi:hypothetical protein